MPLHALAHEIAAIYQASPPPPPFTSRPGNSPPLPSPRSLSARLGLEFRRPADRPGRQPDGHNWNRSPACFPARPGHVQGLGTGRIYTEPGWPPPGPRRPRPPGTVSPRRPQTKPAPAKPASQKSNG